MSALANVQLEKFSVDNVVEITESEMIKEVCFRSLKIGIPTIESLRDGCANLSFK